jgi:predicted Zn-dependent protease
MTEVLGIRCGILVDRGVSSQAAWLKAGVDMYTRDKKNTSALKQALEVLSAQPHVDERVMEAAAPASEAGAPGSEGERTAAPDVAPELEGSQHESES